MRDSSILIPRNLSFIRSLLRDWLIFSGLWSYLFCRRLRTKVLCRYRRSNRRHPQAECMRKADRRQADRHLPAFSFAGIILNRLTASWSRAPRETALCGRLFSGRAGDRGCISSWIERTRSSGEKRLAVDWIPPALDRIAAVASSELVVHDGALVDCGGAEAATKVVLSGNGQRRWESVRRLPKHEEAD